MRCAALILLFAAGAAQAHPGHGIAELWHLLTEPDHLAMIILPIAIAGGLWLRRKNGVRAEFSRRKKTRP
jgi:hydrogenase/urease accessory protein HupE